METNTLLALYPIPLDRKPVYLHYKSSVVYTQVNSTSCKITSITALIFHNVLNRDMMELEDQGQITKRLLK